MTLENTKIDIRSKSLVNFADVRKFVMAVVESHLQMLRFLLKTLALIVIHNSVC